MELLSLYLWCIASIMTSSIIILVTSAAFDVKLIVLSLLHIVTIVFIDTIIFNSIIIILIVSVLSSSLSLSLLHNRRLQHALYEYFVMIFICHSHFHCIIIISTSSLSSSVFSTVVAITIIMTINVKISIVTVLSWQFSKMQFNARFL